MDFFFSARVAIQEASGPPERKQLVSSKYMWLGNTSVCDLLPDASPSFGFCNVSCVMQNLSDVAIARESYSQDSTRIFRMSFDF